METIISEYDQKAIDFLISTNTTFKATFIKNGKYFDDDKEPRDIYEIELARGSRVYKFKFGNSINASGKWHIQYHGKKVFNDDKEAMKFCRITAGYYWPRDAKRNEHFAPPSAYSVLACLTKYDPGTFENFCSDYGYDTDSRKAEKVYKSVLDEWENVQKLFNEQELELMQEIQ